MINQVTKYMLDAIRVPFPPPAEQKKIVEQLDAFAAETQRLAESTAKARRAGGVEKVAAAPGLHWKTLETPMCNDCHSEDDTRAEHIDPALKAAGWGVVEGSRISARVSDHARAASKAMAGAANR